MLNRFKQGTIVDLQTMEDIKNQCLYVVDKGTGKIRNAYNMDEYLTNQLVIVNNYELMPLKTIKKNEYCRCWYVYLVL